MSYQGMTPRELNMAIRAAKRLRDSQRVTESEVCPVCDGEREIKQDDKAIPCPACDGLGQIENEP